MSVSRDWFHRLRWSRWIDEEPQIRGKLYLVIVDWPAVRGAVAMGRYVQIAQWDGSGWREQDEDHSGWMGPVKCVTHWADPNVPFETKPPRAAQGQPGAGER